MHIFSAKNSKICKNMQNMLLHIFSAKNSKICRNMQNMLLHIFGCPSYHHLNIVLIILKQTIILKYNNIIKNNNIKTNIVLIILYCIFYLYVPFYSQTFAFNLLMEHLLLSDNSMYLFHLSKTFIFTLSILFLFKMW